MLSIQEITLSHEGIERNKLLFTAYLQYQTDLYSFGYKYNASDTKEIPVCSKAAGNGQFFHFLPSDFSLLYLPTMINTKMGEYKIILPSVIVILSIFPVLSTHQILFS